MKRNRKLWGLIASVAALGLLVGGVAVASNMGFKYVPNIPTGEYWNLSLPWNNNYAKASELLNDLNNGDTTNDAQSVTRFNFDKSRTDWFKGAPPSQNFAVVKGEGYLVRAADGIDDTVVVGSHDPNFTITYNANEFLNSSAPYHQTHSFAADLFSDMNTQTGDGIDTISRVNSNNTFTDWFLGAPPSQNFGLDLGMAVLVDAGSGGTYNWPHY
jgi:hypothetical protein